RPGSSYSPTTNGFSSPTTCQYRQGDESDRFPIPDSWSRAWTTNSDPRPPGAICLSTRRFEGHAILPPWTTDIAFGSQGWWRWGPPAPTAYFPTGPVLPVLAYCECRYRPRWCYAQCDP